MQHFPSFEGKDAQSVLGTISIGRSEGLYVKHFKRVLDISIVLFTLPFTLPFIFAFWMLVRRDGGPGFFGHVRVGRHGRLFKCWKLRSMHVHAEARLEELLRSNSSAAKQWSEGQKLSMDPRVTTLGALLRKTSIDELPQIWNVLRGEMSIVGPRPVTAAELARYEQSVWAYLSIRPGITGAWQVSGRNTVGYGERISLDVGYLESVGFFRDCAIVVLTFREIVSRSGC